MIGFGDSSGISWSIWHLPPDNHTNTCHSVFTGWMLFLVPNQQCRSTEGKRAWRRLRIEKGSVSRTKELNLLSCCLRCGLRWAHTHTHTHTHPFNGPLSGTTRVSQYQKGETSLDFTEARDSEWQWHQLGHMQVCISLQTDNHTSTPPLSFLQAGCPSCRPTNSVKALKVGPQYQVKVGTLFSRERGNISRSMLKYREYLAHGRYSQLYLVGGSRDAAF